MASWRAACAQSSVSPGSWSASPVWDAAWLGLNRDRHVRATGLGALAWVRGCSIPIRRIEDEAAELPRDKRRIVAVLRHEFSMRSTFRDAPVFQHDDARRIHNGGEPMCDDERGSALRELLERVLHC